MGYTSFAAAGGGGANQNLSQTQEAVGFGADGLGELLTANSTAHQKAASWTPLGTLANSGHGLTLSIGPGSASTMRIYLDVRINGVVVITDLYLEPAGARIFEIEFDDLTFGAGLVEARIQAATGSQTIRLGAKSDVRDANSAPGYTQLLPVGAMDSAATRPPSAHAVSFQDAAGTAWTTMVASLADSSGKFLVSPGSNGTTPAASQPVRLQLALGGSGSEVVVHTMNFRVDANGAPAATCSPTVCNDNFAATERLSARINTATPGVGPDGLRLAIYRYA